jgi:hypothetical protein
LYIEELDVTTPLAARRLIQSNLQLKDSTRSSLNGSGKSRGPFPTPLSPVNGEVVAQGNSQIGSFSQTIDKQRVNHLQ